MKKENRMETGDLEPRYNAFQAGNTGSNPVGDTRSTGVYEGERQSPGITNCLSSSPRAHHADATQPPAKENGRAGKLTKAVPLPERLRLQYRLDPETGCWLWTGAIIRAGYGMVGVNGRKVPAHRAVYELERGPIPAGLELDHLCRVRRCVRPDHLEPVTQAENFRRGHSNAADNARKTHCKRGHELAGENLYRSPDGHRHCFICTAAAKRRHYERNRERLIRESAERRRAARAPTQP